MASIDTSPDAPQSAVAGSFLDKLATGDFAQLAAVLEPDVALRALLPGGYREWHGADDVCDRFQVWFGDVDEFEVLDAAVALVGSRLQLRWRVRVVGERFGEGPRLVEQIVYADTGATGRIGTMSLLCTGYLTEPGDG